MSEDSSSEDEDYTNSDRQFHIVYNWSMTGDAKEVQSFCKKINYAAEKFESDVKVSVAPPGPFLVKMRKLLKKKIEVCSQNCCHEEVGAFTGEVSASMLRDVKATGVICGHWERRRRFGEDPDIVALQVQRATERRLTAFLCFGEDMEERTEGRTMSVISSQISPLFQLPIDWKRVVLVYEPIWAFKDEKLIAREVELPPVEIVVEEEESDKNDNLMTTTMTTYDENEDPGDPMYFDDRKYDVILPPKSQHVDDMLNDVRLWLKNQASKTIARTTSILYGGHVAAEDGPEFAKMKNIDGLLAHRKSLILDKVDDEAVDEQTVEDDFDDFLQLIHRCGEERKEEENLNRGKFKAGIRKKTGTKEKQRGKM